MLDVVGIGFHANNQMWKDLRNLEVCAYNE
jgi:hypothetical protein